MYGPKLRGGHYSNLSKFGLLAGADLVLMYENKIGVYEICMNQFCCVLGNPEIGAKSGLFFVHFAKNSRPKKLKFLAFGEKLKGFFAKNSRL